VLSYLGIDGEFELVFGTSASSPVVGSMITLINDARIAHGKGPVGKYCMFMWFTL
jgi:tripeptidyl-peptidase I